MSEAYSKPAASDGAQTAAPIAEGPEEEAAEGAKLRYSDEDFLRLVRDERQRSIGFGDGDNGELSKVRIKAQEYGQGKINDLETIKGRSAAVDTTFPEAVDTVMPDVLEVFFGGDDVVSFDATGPGDEARASEESDVVRRVVFGQNAAFRAFHDAFQDAFYNRTGLFYWWWEDEEKNLGEQVAPSPAMAKAIAAIVAQRTPWARVGVEQREDGSVALSFSELRGRACFKAVPSEDFTVAADTVELRDTTYCCLRDRPRVQELIKRGIDKAKARKLPRYSIRDDAMEEARDEAGEHQARNEDELDDLRQVEVRCHYLRVDADDDGDIEIWRIETDAEEKTLLQKEIVSHIPFGPLTPYLQAHRFYGQSLFDKLSEVMRIKTVLLRMMLDSGYFALNQRYEVSEDQANEFTLADLLNNAPNVPVRSKNGNAVRPLQAGELGFDVFGAMEFMSTVGEQRSGVVRNAQGLNPDTLHDTARGMQALISAANKRVRMICRVFAETGVKDLFLGVHQLLREHSGEEYAPIDHQVGPEEWSQIQPSTWPERQMVTAHVGVGAGHEGADVETQNRALELLQQVVQLQGGVNGPFVTPANVFNRLKAFSRAIGEKDPSQFWTNPGDGPIQPPGAGGPNPELLKLQGEQQIAEARLQGEQRLEEMRLAGQMKLRAAETQGKLQLQRDQAGQALQLQREETAAELELRREELALRTRFSPNVTEDVQRLPGGLSGG